MRTMHFVIGLILPALVMFGTLPVAAQEKAPAAVEIKVVKYAGLGQIIKQQKGKIVVVDFWSDTCIPCKKEFPHLVEMHKKYSGDGVVTISVSLDDAKEDGTAAKVRKFLEAQHATFTNLILDEKPEVWQDKLKFDGPPCVYVFGRDGKVAKQFKDEFTFADVESLVKELLEKE
jgi:thiol-disulfide isomerase/thioredoxin